MAFFAYKGIKPVVDPSAWIHPDATIIGEVIIGKNVFIGAHAVLRGDWGKIIVLEGANVQETCVVHTFPNKSATIGENAHIGHGAIIHGAHIGTNAMIGMNAVIMDNANIGENTIIGTLSFVKEGMEIAPNRLAFGNPIRDVRALTNKEITWKSNGTKLYQELALARCTQPCEPLSPSESQANRAEEPAHHAPKQTIK